MIDDYCNLKNHGAVFSLFYEMLAFMNRFGQDIRGMFRIYPKAYFFGVLVDSFSYTYYIIEKGRRVEVTISVIRLIFSRSQS